MSYDTRLLLWRLRRHPILTLRMLFWRELWFFIANHCLDKQTTHLTRLELVAIHARRNYFLARQRLPGALP